MHTRPLVLAAVVAGGVLLSVASAPAASIEQRTLRLSAAPSLGASDGSSSGPVVSANGAVTAFSTVATNLGPQDPNGPLADIVVVNAPTGERRLVSRGADGGGADGASTDPAISADGQRVAFTSSATNLVAGDLNAVTDVFVALPDGPVLLVSARPDGQPGNRPSRNADLSSDGRFVVFESDASDLVPGDTNGASDIFVRDLLAGQTQRVSVASDGAEAVGASTTPAISGDGRVVSFESRAANLVPRDTNRVPDVFVRALRLRRTERVSVSASGRQQDRAVTAPFHLVSDLDATGRRVVFDSEATNLTPDDTNRASDVFLVDRRADTIDLVSASTGNVQGNNDSVSPVITPDGRFVAFQSFATNLVAQDPTGADVVLRDRELRATTLVTVTSTGSRRGAELVPQLLERPALSDDGAFAAFVSTSPTFTAGDLNRHADVFLRVLAPAATLGRRGAGTIRVASDDVQADSFLCYVRAQAPRPCGPRVTLPRAGGTMVIRSTGPGVLVDPEGLRVRLPADRTRPVARVVRKASSVRRQVSGTATDRGGSGVRAVEVAVIVFRPGTGCSYFDGRRMRPTKNCNLRRFVPATVVGETWTVSLPAPFRRAIVGVFVRARDAAGNRSRTVQATSFLA